MDVFELRPRIGLASAALADSLGRLRTLFAGALLSAAGLALLARI